MTVRADIIAETGLDLSNSNIGADTLAGWLVDRVKFAFPFETELTAAFQGILGSYKLMTGAVTPLAVYAAALSLLKAGASILEGRLDDDISGNFKRMEAARNLTIQTYVKPGDWSVVVPAGGLPVGKVDLYNNVGGWDEAKFLAQYNPGIVWMSHRTAKSDILLPTWPSPPYTDGFGMLSGPQGTNFVPNCPLTGWRSGVVRKFVSGQPQCAPFPAKYDHDYFGTMPSASPQELLELQGPVEGAFKGLKKLQQKMDEAFYKQAFVPPPDYTYLFSVGTYPYTSWSTAASYPMTGGSAVVMNATMAVVAAAIHSFTPMHAAVVAAEVAQCYTAWLAASRIRFLQPVPAAQFDPKKCSPEDHSCGVFLDAKGLPTSSDDAAVVQFVTAKRSNEAQAKGYPLGLAPSYRINWRVVRAIEQSFRSFFKIRRAALYQMDLLPEDFRTAAAKSRDPILSAVAKTGKPPPYRPWSERDPLNEGSGDLVVVGPLNGKFGAAPVAGGDLGGVLVLGGLALALGYALTR